MGTFLGGRVILSGAVSPALVRLESWALRVLAGDFDSVFENYELEVDLVQKLAVQWTDNAFGLEFDVLRKSLQEVLFCVAGPEVELPAGEMIRRVRLFLQNRGTAGLLKRFLGFHVFNVVWFQTGDNFRALAWTPHSFFQDMNNVERFCCRLVSNIWNSSNISGPLDSASAFDLVERLENTLTRA